MRVILISFLALASTLLQAATLPQDSIYQLDASWQASAAKTMQLADLQGKKQVLAMFYSHCATACPVIVADMQKIERALSAQQKTQLGFVLVSLDPERDTAESMAAFAKKRGLGDNWQLLQGSKDAVRSLSMLLDVHYQDTDDGEIAHSKVLHFLDEQGRIVSQSASVDDVTKLLKSLGL